MRLRGVTLYLPGAAVVVFGLWMMSMAMDFPFGSLLRPGPGFFPVVIAAILIFLGLGVMVETLRSALVDDAGPEVQDRFAWRPLLCTCAGILLFAVIVERAGFIPASFALIFVAAFGEPGRNWLVVLLLALFLSVFGTGVFIWGLGLPIEPFGAT